MTIGPAFLDCIEFGGQYRWGDVLADVAFLSMDLERLGRGDLAKMFLDLHRELVADQWPATLADHYIAYRAHVRAKVGIVRGVQQGAQTDPAVDPYMGLALQHLATAQVRMILVGGSPGTGKSTLAAGLGDQLGAVVLRTDEVRDRVPMGASASRYAPEAVTAVYLAMLLEARRLVGLGEHVILDATWSSGMHRELARMAAQETSCDVIEMQCTLPRLRRRAASRSSGSW